jgi:hypothetical protein
MSSKEWQMRIFSALFVMCLLAGDCWAEDRVEIPSFDSNRSCNAAFGQDGVHRSALLLKICLRSEQKSYNLSRAAWDYISPETTRLCDERVKRASLRARAIRKFGYEGLVDPYTELWQCVEMQMRVEESRAPAKAVEKW